MILTNKKVLIFENDPGCLFTYQEILDLRYQTKYLSKFSDILDYLKSDFFEMPDLIISDLKLYDGHLLNYLFTAPFKELENIPLLIISSTEDVDMIRFCLQKRAKDYLIKPFKRNELIVKVEFHLNSTHSRESEEKIHPDFLKIKRSPDYQYLTRKEQNILDLFFKSKNLIVQRNELNEKIWGDTYVHGKTLDVHLYNLRKKILPFNLTIVSTDVGKWMLTRSDESSFPQCN